MAQSLGTFSNNVMVTLFENVPKLWAHCDLFCNSKDVLVEVTDVQLGTKAGNSHL